MLADWQCEMLHALANFGVHIWPSIAVYCMIVEITGDHWQDERMWFGQYSRLVVMRVSFIYNVQDIPPLDKSTIILPLECKYNYSYNVWACLRRCIDIPVNSLFTNIPAYVSTCIIDETDAGEYLRLCMWLSMKPMSIQSPVKSITRRMNQ